ncbi:MAG: helix-turn-helix transcriptional regulator [Alphaproteobacteria bacterium]
MPKKIPNILGDQLKEAREKAGLTLQDVATKASLSKKQVQEIENGGASLFYTVAIKLTAAKKVGKLLGLHDDDFLQPIAIVPPPPKVQPVRII